MRENKESIFSFDKIEFARFDFRINESGAYLIELSTDCAIGPDCIPNKAFEKMVMILEKC